MRDVLRTQFRFLCFRPIRPDLVNQRLDYVVYVLLVTWAVGVGRYWDHPSALPWQYAGLGSLAYVFVLSTFLWLIVAPLRPPHWRWFNVFIFVGLTSLPAALYATPVERFVPMSTAMSLNAWFLGIVALWRVALYSHFLWTYAQLRGVRIVVSVLLPLSLIVFALAALNLEHVVFNLMSGIRESDASPNDLAYVVVFVLAFFGFWTTPFSVILYVYAIVTSGRARREALSAAVNDSPDARTG